MAAEQAWYVAERAEALAIVYLTRRGDLEVTPVSRCVPNPKYDLLVQIKEHQGASPTAFAVEVKGVLSQSRSLQGDRFSITLSPAILEGDGIPTCIFLFNVDDEQGYHRWLHRPVISHRGPELVLDIEDKHRRNGHARITGSFDRLDDDAIGSIVEQVRAWHEAKNRQVASSHII